MKIGVFDSGLGGLSVAQALEKALPEHEVIFRHDQKHFPYGSKKPEELIEYVEPILQGLVRSGCAVIVVACNTVSTTMITELRRRIAIHLVAIEPMVKPAASLTKSGVIAVCATPATLKSDRYQWLKEEYAKNIKVLEPNCNNWARMIDQKRIDRAIILDQINDLLILKADVIVLACTHYQWIRTAIESLIKDRAVCIGQIDLVIENVEQQLKKLQMQQ